MVDPVVPSLPKDFFDVISGVEELSHCLRLQPTHCTWVKRKWLCCRCKVLLVRAWTSESCGHSFCSDCLQEIVYFRDVCPRDKTAIWKSKFLRGEYIEHEVSRTFVRCPFGCNSNYPVVRLLQHKGECKGNLLTSNPVVAESKSCDESCKFKMKCELYESLMQKLDDKIKRQDDKLAKQLREIDCFQRKMMSLQRTASEELDKVSKERDAMADNINHLKERIMLLEERQSNLSDSTCSICDVICVTPNFEAQGNNTGCQNSASNSGIVRDFDKGSGNGNASISGSGNASISCSGNDNASIGCSGNNSSACTSTTDEVSHVEQHVYNYDSLKTFTVMKKIIVTITNLRELVQLSRLGTETPYQNEEFCVDNRGHHLQIIVYLNGLKKYKGKWVSVLIKAVENNVVQDETLWPLKKHVQIMLSAPIIKKKAICFVKTIEFLAPGSTWCVMKFFDKKLLDEIICEQNHMSLNINVSDECDMDAENKKSKKFFKK